VVTAITCNTIKCSHPKTYKRILHPSWPLGFHFMNTHRLGSWGSWGPGAGPQSLLSKGLVLGEVARQLHERVGTPAFGLHQLPHCHGDHQFSDGQKIGTEVRKTDPSPTLNSEGICSRWQMSVPQGPGCPPLAASSFAVAPTSARNLKRAAPLKASAFRVGLSSSFHV
jgi:hypothetical protein